MKCVVSLCLLALASSHLSSWQESEEDNLYFIQIIHFLSDAERFKYYITFFGDQEFAFQGPPLQRCLMETFQVPLIVAGRDIGPLHQTITSRSLAIVLFTSLNDPILKAVQENLEGLQHMSLIFVYKSKNLDPLQAEFIESFFKWCWERRWVYALLMLKNQSRFEEWTFGSLHAMTIKKLPQNKWFRSNPNSRNFALNLRNYKILMPVFENVPEAIMYNSTDGKLSFGGIIGIISNVFARFANASIEILPLPGRHNYDESVRRLAGNRSIDLGGNLLENDTLLEYSPMIYNARFCLVVPHRRPSPMTEYFGDIRKIHLPVVVGGSIVFYTIIKRLTNPLLTLSRAVENSVWSSLGIPLAGTEFNRLSLAEKFMEISLQLYNVCYSSIFGSFVATRLTSGVFEPEIDDVESMLASGLPIMIDDNATQQLFQENRLPYVLKDRIIMVNSQTLEHNLNSLNTSNAYVMDMQQYLRMAYIQEFLKYPKLKLGTKDLCTASRFLRLPVSMGSPFKEVLFYFGKQITEAGLHSKFVQFGLEQGHRLGRYARMKEETVAVSGLPLEFFRFTFTVYLVLMGIAILVFFIELWLKRK